MLRPSYNRITALTIDLQQLGPLPATAQAAKRMQPGNRDAPREIGAGVDIQVDARAERGDGDADSRGVGSVVATVARRCTGREPMSMASAAAATVTVEPSVRWSGTRQRHSLDRCCRRLCRMCRTFQKSLVNRVVRPCVTACRHAVFGVEAQDVFNDDTGVAETPQRLDGGSDNGHGRVCGQAFGHDCSSFAARKRAALRERGIAE